MSWFSRFRGKTPAARVTPVVVPRRALSEDPATGFVGEALRIAVQEAISQNDVPFIHLTIAEYDSDPRELFEIPEVCEWARSVRQQLPALFFFLDRASRLRFVGWLCGPASRAQVEKPNFKERFLSTLHECAGDTIKWRTYLGEAGASDECISAMREVIISSAGKDV